MSRTASITLVLFLVLMAQVSVFGMDRLPTTMKRLWHLFVEPDDLFDPVVQEKFNFWEKGYSVEFPLAVKYEDLYAVTIDCLDKKNCIPSGWGTSEKYQFRGKIKADFFCKNKLVFSQEIVDAKAVVYQAGEMDYLKKIVLLSFAIPIKGKYKDDLKLRLTVLEPDLSLQEYGSSIELSVAVSGTK